MLQRIEDLALKEKKSFPENIFLEHNVNLGQHEKFLPNSCEMNLSNYMPPI